LSWWLNEPISVAFQGERGAYSEIAAEEFFNCDVKFIPCRDLEDVFKIVEDSHVDYGIIPVENSIEGSVARSYDLMRESNLKIVGEVTIRISHCLISYHDYELRDIRRVYSHPQALGQCRSFIRKWRLTPYPTYDTAGSVKMLSRRRIRYAAAIASRKAAEIYGLKVLIEGIEDNKNNYTRFLIVSKKFVKPVGRVKTSIVFTVKHVPGSLYKALEVFASRGINLTKIESRPVIGRPWEYYFYLDFEGGVEDDAVKDALKELSQKTTYVKVLGSYKQSSNHYALNHL